VFRERAVSYMSRFDRAHVDPSESNFDAMGRGVEEGKQPEHRQRPNAGLKPRPKAMKARCATRRMS
jgi:hypothetical protein